MHTDARGMKSMGLGTSTEFNGEGMTRAGECGRMRH